MTDTKYVPSHAEVFRLLLQFWTGERCRIPLSSQDARTILAQPLRIAGPDDAIVPLDALRVARDAITYCIHLAQDDLNGYHLDAEAEAALAAIDAAIAAATPPEQHHDA